MLLHSSRQRRTPIPTSEGDYPAGFSSISSPSASTSTSTSSSASIYSHPSYSYHPVPNMPTRGKAGEYSAFDPELGSSSRYGPTAAGRLARRVLARRGRWVAGAALFAGTLLYIYDWRTATAEGVSLSSGLARETGDPGVFGSGSGSGIAHSSSDKGKGKGKATGTSTTSLDLDYVVDEYGDYFFHSYPPGNVPPFDPDISLLPEPDELFPEVNLPVYLRQPRVRPFPDERIREIVSPPPTGKIKDKIIVYSHPWGGDAFVANWTGAENWNPKRKQGKKIQYAEFKESRAEKRIREARAEAVRRGFAHAWQAYKDHAWGHDEVKPVSKVPSDPFNGWGATIVDSLDTLLVLGFSDEYNLCRAHVNQLKFEWVLGKDWRDGYTMPIEENGEDEASGASAEPKSIGRDTSVGLGVFETAIRYLGGLVGAYDLSGDDLMLERAVDLANILHGAYRTKSGLPSNRLDPGTEQLQLHLSTVSLAEVGTMTLELFRLSQITGNRTWHDLAQRTIDYLDTHVAARSTQPPLIPLWFSPDAVNTQYAGTFAWGGLADSYYEYLIKAYRLLGGEGQAPRTDQYKRLYQDTVNVSKTLLFWDIDVVPDREILAIGKWDNGRPVPEIEHLTCFAGAMMGLGAKLLDRPEDMDDAEVFTRSCYWLSAATPTGLQPEVVEFYDSTASGPYENISLSTGKTHHPHVSKVDVQKELDANRVQKDAMDTYRWTDDWSMVDPDAPPPASPPMTSNMNENVQEGEMYGDDADDIIEPPVRIPPLQTEPQRYYQKVRGVPAGTRIVHGRGINRPETIESIFYMYRLTGDKKWQDRGWKMFVSWMQTAKVAGGVSSVYDVTQENFVHDDNMESFAFAETFKYHYLLQADTNLISLDDYVLNTEAHPLISNPTFKPGHSKLWTPPPPHSPAAILGKRGEGTHAQKWQRYEHLEPFKAALRAPIPGVPDAADAAGRRPLAAGGKGMGGGGGKPGEKPKLPPEFYMRPDVVT